MDCGSPGGSELQSAINVTPLVDVVLVLLIILMVIVPLALHGYDLAIPRASAEPAPQPTSEPVVLEIDPALCPATVPSGPVELAARCRVRLDGSDVALAELPARAAALLGAREPAERVLLLAAHDRINYEAAMRVVDLAQSAVPRLRIGVIDAATASDLSER
jgi:biopolymer transport protein ExbD